MCLNPTDSASFVYFILHLYDGFMSVSPGARAASKFCGVSTVFRSRPVLRQLQELVSLEPAPAPENFYIFHNEMYKISCNTCIYM